MHRDQLIVQYDQSGSARVLALSGKTGEKIWETQRNVKVSWASPVLVNTGTRTELILAAEPDVISYDPSTGRELWKIDCISGEVGPSVAYANGIVFSVNDYSKLAAIRIGDSPSIAWESDEYLPDVPSPVAMNNLLFLVTSYGTLVCYDASTGDKHWEHELGKSVYASPVIADGRLFVMDKTGVMHMFSVSEELAAYGTASLGEGSSCTPVFSDGRIFIRGNKNLYCIGK
jgi:outer membrane protein assembly factor BamB